LKQEKK